MNIIQMLLCVPSLHECGQAMFSSMLGHADREKVGWLCPTFTSNTRIRRVLFWTANLHTRIIFLLNILLLFIFLSNTFSL